MYPTQPLCLCLGSKFSSSSFRSESSHRCENWKLTFAGNEKVYFGAVFSPLSSTVSGLTFITDLAKMVLLGLVPARIAYWLGRYFRQFPHFASTHPTRRPQKWAARDKILHFCLLHAQDTVLVELPKLKGQKFENSQSLVLAVSANNAVQRRVIIIPQIGKIFKNIFLKSHVPRPYYVHLF